MVPNFRGAKFSRFGQAERFVEIKFHRPRTLNIAAPRKYETFCELNLRATQILSGSHIKSGLSVIAAASSNLCIFSCIVAL